MQWRVILMALGLTAWLQACADDEPAEEPVQPATEEKSEQGEAADSFEPDAGGSPMDDTMPPQESDMNNGMPPPADPSGQDEPTANPSVQQPAPDTGGGIISGGNKSWEDCKKILKFGDRKRCFEQAMKDSKKDK